MKTKSTDLLKTSVGIDIHKGKMFIAQYTPENDNIDFNLSLYCCQLSEIDKIEKEIMGDLYCFEKSKYTREIDKFFTPTKVLVADQDAIKQMYKQGIKENAPEEQDYWDAIALSLIPFYLIKEVRGLVSKHLLEILNQRNQRG